ncbi:hypothetical protein GF386_04915 [Candidatus Pacearchaeota archaeon]|nr:hypothetical protein [Candidatus Pacearchaeota archaeon]MBD3283454.1 hypothetical protein [Candidatus Pacearchaeota archaeon]
MAMDLETETHEGVIGVSRNGRGFRIDAKRDEIPRIAARLKNGGISVSIPPDYFYRGPEETTGVYEITCPRFVDDNGNVCRGACLSEAVREHLCKNPEECPTYNPEANRYEPPKKNQNHD